MEVGGARRLGVRRVVEGDRVVVYEGLESMKMVTVQSGQLLQNRFGVFRHSEWVGLPYGSRVTAAKGNGFVHLLAPSPALWTKVLPHRTQILYQADISLIIARLAVRPGCVALESGTGSGSLSHSLARAVAPNGKLLSFDFHQGRAEQARAEFTANGISPLASVEVRDIQGHGFPPSLHATAHAVFLDLPCPWLALPSAAASLLRGGRVCSFSPCVEQVQRCCAAMARGGLTDIRTVELLNRSYEVREESLIVPSLQPASDAPNLESSAKAEAEKAGMEEGPEQNGDRGAKRRRGEEADGAEEGDKGPVAGGDDGDGERRGRREVGRRQKGVVERIGEPVSYIAARPAAEAKGHTGYLTFAMKPV